MTAHDSDTTDAVDLGAIRARLDAIGRWYLTHSPMAGANELDELIGHYADSSRDTTALLAEVDRLRAVVEQVGELASEMESDDRSYLDTHGQHLQGSVAKCAEYIRTVLARGGRDGGGDDA